MGCCWTKSQDLDLGWRTQFQANWGWTLGLQPIASVPFQCRICSYLITYSSHLQAQTSLLNGAAFHVIQKLLLV